MNILRLRFFLLLFLTVVLLYSCSVEKRHYRSGFYIGWHERVDQAHSATSCADAVKEGEEYDSVPSKHKLNISSECTTTGDTVEPCAGEDVHSKREVAGRNDQQFEPNESLSQKKLAIPALQKPIDDQPPGKDKPNTVIALLILLGILFAGLLLFAQLAFLPGWAVVLFVLAPIVGVGLYLLAMHHRRKVMQAIANGSTGKAFRLSAHYHRFRLLTQMYFLFALVASVFLLLAEYTGIAASGIAGAFASVLISGSTLLMASLALILFVLAIIYLFYWRKDPTGYAPRRDRHPPKDR